MQEDPVIHHMYSITKLNQMSGNRFVAALGAVFRRNTCDPRIKPGVNTNVIELHRCMVDVVNAMSQGATAKLALVTLHPDLGSKAR